MSTVRLLVVILGLAVAAGCGGPAGTSLSPLYPTDLGVLSAEDAATAKIDISPLPDGVPPPKVDRSATAAIAVANVGAARGDILAVGRARARQFDDPASPLRTVWVVVFGPGGQVPITGPQGGSARIVLQLVLVDDQTGEFLRSYIKSAT